MWQEANSDEDGNPLVAWLVVGDGRGDWIPQMPDLGREGNVILVTESVIQVKQLQVLKKLTETGKRELTGETETDGTGCGLGFVTAGTEGAEDTGGLGAGAAGTEMLTGGTGEGATRLKGQPEDSRAREVSEEAGAGETQRG